MREKILNFLEKIREPIHLRELSVRSGISYPTILKYCGILLAEKKIDIKEYGNMRLILPRRG